MTENRNDMAGYMKGRRATIKERASELLENSKNEELLQWLNVNAPASINATQSGISIKFKNEEFEGLILWIKKLTEKRKPLKIQLLLDTNTILEKLIE